MDEARSLIDRVTRQFAFLDAVGANRTIQPGSNPITLRYDLHSFFVEVEVDQREQSLFALVGKAREGEVPSGYYTDDLGRRCRWHFAELLEIIGRYEEASALDRIAQQAGPAAMALQAKALSTAIAHALDTIPSMLDRAIARDG